jgi:tellurite methyltransferase
MKNNLQKLYGNIDIYLFDQLLKGRFDNVKKCWMLAVAAGETSFISSKTAHEVYGIDPNPNAVAEVQALSKTLAPANALKNFVNCPAENMPFEDAAFDLVICSAVLHFAEGQQPL